VGGRLYESIQGRGAVPGAKAMGEIPVTREDPAVCFWGFTARTSSAAPCSRVRKEGVGGRSMK
jgi:hypothetical protein